MLRRLRFAEVRDCAVPLARRGFVIVGRDNAPMTSSAKRPGLAALRRLLLISVVIIGLYYLAPFETGVTGAQLVLRTVGTVAGGAAVTWLIARQVSHHLADPDQASLSSLLTALVCGVVFFALADYLTAISGQDQFADLRTKTDALYFALSTLTTVGYGDVHATGQVARVVVIIQLLFNVAIIATGVSVFTRQIGARVRARRAAGPP
jgi:voltage-gated potassium channel